MMLTTGKKFKQNFLSYSIARRLSRESETSYQASVFLVTIREEAYNVYHVLKFDSKENKIDLGIVIKKFVSFTKSSSNKTYESYKLHLWKEESIESYIACSATIWKELQFQRATRQAFSGTGQYRG